MATERTDPIDPTVARVAEFISENLTPLDQPRPHSSVFLDDARALVRLVRDDECGEPNPDTHTAERSP